MKLLRIFLALAILVSITAFIAVKDKKGLDPKTVKYLHKRSDWRQVDDSLFMFQTEVSNLQYREFLNYLKKQGKMDEYYKYCMDTIGYWNVTDFHDEHWYAAIYHTHSLFDNYPIANITYDGAVAYCSWLTDVYNEGKHSFKKVKVRLPSKQEWLTAAKLPYFVAKSGNVKNNWDYRRYYPWGGYAITDRNGNMLANCLVINPMAVGGKYGSGNITVDTTTWRFYAEEDGYRYHAPVKSFYLNEKGLYNLCGNVAEMLNEPGTTIGGSWGTTAYYMRLDVDADPYKDWTEPSPFIGFRPVMEVIEE